MNNPLSPEHHRAWAALLAVQAQIVRKINLRLAAAGMISMEDYDILLALEDAPEGQLRLYELADKAVLTRSGITRLVDRLSAAGLVERSALPTNRRAIYARITSEGLAERKRTWPVYREAVAELFGRAMSRDEAAGMANALEKALRRNAPPCTDFREDSD